MSIKIEIYNSEKNDAGRNWDFWSVVLARVPP